MTSKEALDKIGYDLGILDLLRQYIYFDKKDYCIKMSDIKKSITNFDFELLKEWLEE